MYGTSQLQQPEIELRSLVFNTESRREESDAEAEPPEQFHAPLEESDEVILDEPVNAERETLPPLEGEEEGEVEEASDAEEQDLESSGDLTITRDALAKATKTLSQAQVRSNRTQVEIIQRQDELDQLLRQWGQSAVSKQDFDSHTKSVMEYIDVVKSNAKMTCDNVKIEMKTLQQQVSINESRQSKDLKKVREKLTTRSHQTTRGIRIGSENRCGKTCHRHTWRCVKCGWPNDGCEWIKFQSRHGWQ